MFAEYLQNGPVFYFANPSYDETTGLPPLTIEGTPPDPAMERRVPWPVSSLYLGRTLGGLDIEPQFQVKELPAGNSNVPDDVLLTDQKLTLNTKLAFNGDLDVLDFFELASGADDGFIRDAGGEPTTSKHSILVAITNLNSENEAIRNIVMYRYYFRCWVAPAKLTIGPNHNFLQTTIHVLTGRKPDNCPRDRGRQLYRRWRVLWYEPNIPIHRSVRTIYG